MKTIEEHESQVRSYSRNWPASFARARGAIQWDTEGNRYVDFFSGAGSLNYGHNEPRLKQALLDYLAEDGVIHSLDMFTPARSAFLQRFSEVILEPRGLDYKVQFPGPTGTNAVEAAMKLARKATGRERIVGFTNAFHGMTLGALSVTGNNMKRGGAGVLLQSGTAVPYYNYFGEEVDTTEYLDQLLTDDGSGFDLPAAVIVETLQGEGGMATASMEWLRALQEVCNRHEVLLIVDDIQAGCGRTGTFFSFEPAGIKPDIVTLSKSLSGFGLPFALTLIRPELDVWEPGEHNGTFRGHNPAFVTATAALDYWVGEGLTPEIDRKAARVTEVLDQLVADHPELEGERRGRGLFQGVAAGPGFAKKVTEKAFGLGLLVETSGPEDEVIKLLPPLTIDDETLEEGLALLTKAILEVVEADQPEPAGQA
jgi:diaminobutyrate-2-oxoglutarate transaminase